VVVTWQQRALDDSGSGGCQTAIVEEGIGQQWQWVKDAEHG
jgi:hypothetical protein